jgi:hypothetical protein
MSFRLDVRPSVRKRMAAWPDVVMVEAYLRLRERLAVDPHGCLARVTKPFDGLVYSFSMVDSTNRLIEHFCFFHVVYGADESSLAVVNAGYAQRFGV